MTDRQPIETKNLDRYGYAELPWSRPHDLLVKHVSGPETPWFLGSVGEDGRPHSAGVGVAWFEGDLYFTSNLATRKARNLARNPAASFSTKQPGIDLVFEGVVERVADPNTLEEVTALYRDAGWPAEVENGALTAPFSAPSAGPPPWYLFRFRYEKVIGVANAEPYGATRWRFA